MIYIVKESVMNGTVTVNINVTGIEADTFEHAISRFKEIAETNGIKLTNPQQTKDNFFFNESSTTLDESPFYISGIIESKPLIVK